MKKLFEFIMLIDDHYPSNYYHEIVIQDSGLVEKWSFFDSTIIALQYFREALDSNNLKLIPEVILLDINIPILNGWDFLEKLTALQLPISPKVVILSTSATSIDWEKVNKNPLVISCYPKPLKQKHLYEIHQKLSNRGKSQTMN